MAKWIEYRRSADFNGIAKEFSIDPVIARVMVNRGLESIDEMKTYLHPTWDEIGDGNKMKDMALAVSLLQGAISEQVLIRIIGDYDIDGVQSTYILYQGLKRCGAQVSYGIPHRVEDGYGLNQSLVEKAIDDGVGMIITCDNGIAAKEAIQFAKDQGLLVIVTDHHEIPEELPPADAIVNPKQMDCDYPFKKLCGAAVAWHVVRSLYEKMDIAVEESDVFIENVAFATVGDVMELVGENRTMVALGLRALSGTKNLGMQTLMKQLDLWGKPISAYHIGFVLGPCINASGRLDSASKSLELLLAEDPLTANALAETLIVMNQERKEMTEKGIRAGIEIVESGNNYPGPVLVVYLPMVHESIAGIVAGRLRERFEKPCFVITDSADGEELKGSGRSMEGFSMYEEMCKCKELFTKFGGHPMAAGLSLPKENLEAFAKAINDNSSVQESQLQNVVRIDAAMPFSYVTKELVEQLELLEPFGNGNSKPVFAQKNVRLTNISRIGKQKQFVKAKAMGDNGIAVDALYFGDGDELIEAVDENGQVLITYYPQINSYMGRETLQIIITGFCV